MYSLTNLPLRSPIFLFLGGAVVLSAACGQAPLYYSNQNQYFLHGMAQAGVGQLRYDWLANTLDPTPVFSALVAFTIRTLHPWMFHVYYGLLLGAYAAASVGLFAFLAGEQARKRWPVFVGLFVLVHAALLRWASYRWLGKDYPYYLQGGLAGQYILGGMLQPSAFGMLLVVAVCQFVRGRPFQAGAFVALSATCHSTYLLPGALVTAGFLTALLVEKQGRQALALGAWTLGLVLPVTLYVFLTFRPGSAEAFAESQNILANIRIPHHTRIDLWLDQIAGFQIAWMVLGIALAWRTRLFPVLAVTFGLAALLTLVQALTRSHTLALLFPWRISAVLVPIATTVVLSRLVLLSVSWMDNAVVPRVMAGVVAVLAVTGVWIVLGRQGYVTNDEELPVFDYVRQHLKRGDLYLLPVSAPKAPTRGSFSTDFKPLPEKKVDAQAIPLDLQRFRLHTGAPIFVDFKAIPYADDDVIEWYSRLQKARQFAEALSEGKFADVLEELRENRITHLIVPVEVELKHFELTEMTVIGRYRIFRLRPETSHRDERAQVSACGGVCAIVSAADAGPRRRDRSAGLRRGGRACRTGLP